MNAKPAQKSKLASKKPFQRIWALPGHRWRALEFYSGASVPERILGTSPCGKMILVEDVWAGWEDPEIIECPKATPEIADSAKKNLQILIHRVKKQNNEAAAVRLARVLCDAVSEFSELCKEKPELFQSVARIKRRWPVMMSSHPNLRDLPVRTEESWTLFDNLQLGKNTGLNLDRAAKWKPDEAAYYARSLLGFLQEAQRVINDRQFTYGEFATKIAALPKFTVNTSDNKKPAEKWWELAKAMFLHSYPEPQTIPELVALVKTPSRLKSPGRVKQRILDMLKNRFLSLA